MATTADEDEVVMEMEVFLTQELAEQLHVFQYPLRPQWKPHDLGALKCVRHRRQQRAVQLEFGLDRESVHYDDSSRHLLETSVLTSTPVPALTNQCIAVVKDGKVHLTPLHAVVQMRPVMTHLDAEDTARREEREKEARADKRGARPDAGAMLDAAEEEEKGDEEDMQMLQVQFRRAESERVLERKRTSYASLHEAREREPWAELAFQPAASEESERLRQQLLCTSKAHIPFSCSAEEYLARLSCGRAHHRGADSSGGHLGMPIDLEQASKLAVRSPPRPAPPAAALTRLAPPPSRPRARAPSRPQEQLVSAEQGSLSKEALRQMRPSDRALAILRQTHAMSYARLCSLCGTPPGAQLLAEIADVAVLVQGCWVLRSALACSNERDARCRDLLLLHFTRKRDITSAQFAQLSGLPMPLAREMLARVATARPGHGWEFKVLTDGAFEREHPQVSLAQREEWRRVEHELGRRAVGSTAALPAAGAGRDGGAIKRGKASGAGGRAAAGQSKAAARQQPQGQ